MRSVFYVVAICWRQRKTAKTGSDSQNERNKERGDHVKHRQMRLKGI
jgi:hypothetical protein